MEYQIYLDVIFFVNFLMDFVLLFLISNIFHYPTRMKRLLFGAAIGAVGACIVSIIPFYLSIVLYIVLNGLTSMSMIYITFRPNSLRLLVKQMISLYIVTFLFGGIMNWLFNETQTGQLVKNVLANSRAYSLGIISFLVITTVSFIIIKLCSDHIAFMKKDKQNFMSVTLTFEENSVKTVGFLDTGNGLRDPMTGKPVIVGDYNVIKQGLKESYRTCIEEYRRTNQLNYEAIEKDGLCLLRWIPYQSVGKKDGMMIGILCSECVIQDGKQEVSHEKIVVAFPEHELSVRQEYFVILHTELVQR